MRKFSRRWVYHSLSDPQKVAGVEAVKEMLRISRESETNDFDDIAAGEESWFQHKGSSKMFAPSAADVIPRRWQAVGVSKP
jgi:hypothetical protein